MNFFSFFSGKKEENMDITEPNIAQLAPWVSKTTDCMELRLVQPQLDQPDASEPITFTSFEPAFTYPIFGEQEVVFGYKGLSIQISYTSGSLRIYPRNDYKEKYVAASSSSASTIPESADDVSSMILDFLPKQDCFSNYDEFVRTVQEDAEAFRPMGEKVHEYTRESSENDNEEEHFEIYRTSLANEKFREYHRRMQFFVLLFIEGSSYIEEEDEKWEVYTVYKRQKAGASTFYHFVGYCTTYPFFYWPECTRLRISQFLILPPYQKAGHGSELYQVIYSTCMARNDVKELTVEDPSEDFADMRDRNDLRYLNTHKALDDLVAPVSRKTMKELRQKYKLTDRQMQRCVEMYLLSRVNRLQKEEYKVFRLQVKQRLYLYNLDVLKDLEFEDRKEKLEQTFENVIEDYHRLLEMI
ncbi:acyl-CoA N-acyltransferase [Phascolomyces articulosus]|uniref:Histone acetyltransferase type B catalytic subunit n=1 Tax=Phascolomyces articulosus TaxID=60185 RepID=A0AAD5KCJ1_9FUNG|nr:acyl-CoA N-acyltransferase [Phascolomyces articulosus]